MKVLLAFFVFVMSFQVKASPSDIYGRGDKFIKVTSYENGASVGFELCKIAKPSNCFQIGNRKMYTKVELEKLRRSEGKDIVLSVLADVGIGIVAVYGGALAGGVLVSAAGGITSVGVAGGVITGSTLTTALAMNVDSINPAEQYRQTRMLKDDVISDQTVRIDRSVDDIARTLQTVLNNLDN